MSPRRAVVVGATSQIGAAIAEALQARGDFVIALSRQRAVAADRWIACDVTDVPGLERAVGEACEEPPDALVYAAGSPAMGKTLEVPMAAAERAFDVNFWGLVHAVKVALPRMETRRRGVILAVLSLAATRGVPHEAYYAASKAAAARWLDCVAHEADGVRVKYLCPGFIDTGFLERGGWHGMPVPSVKGSGLTPADVAREALALMESGRASAVIGWRERAITLADRIAPGLYDRWLRARRR